MRIIRICAWCGKEMEHGIDDDHDDPLISHGICDDCKTNILFQDGVNIKTFLDDLKEPVVLVDGDNRVIAANDEAGKVFQKSSEAFEDAFTCDIIECENARYQDACGHAVHCLGCTLRDSIQHTYETGEKREQVPAVLKLDTSERDENINFLISTEKLGKHVFLKITKNGNRESE